MLMNDATRVSPAGLTELIGRLKSCTDRDPNRLSRREHELLEYLGTRSGRIITRDELLAKVWKLDPACTGTRTIDMHMANLRRKVKNVTGLSNLFRNVRGEGYMFVEPWQLSENCIPPP